MRRTSVAAFTSIRTQAHSRIRSSPAASAQTTASTIPGLSRRRAATLAMTSPVTSSNSATSPILLRISVLWPTTVDRPKRICRRPGSPAIDSALAGPCPDVDQRGVRRPQGTDCDIGAVEVLAAEQLPLCVNGYTGAVSTPWSGKCPPGQQQLDPATGTFCINPYTGRVTFVGAGQCAVAVPDPPDAGRWCAPDLRQPLHRREPGSGRPHSVSRLRAAERHPGDIIAMNHARDAFYLVDVSRACFLEIECRQQKRSLPKVIQGYESILAHRDRLYAAGRAAGSRVGPTGHCSWRCRQRHGRELHRSRARYGLHGRRAG